LNEEKDEEDEEEGIIIYISKKGSQDFKLL